MEVECVYFIQSHLSGNIKIGWTKNLWKRLGHIQAHSGEQIDLRVHITGQDMKRTEAEFHRRFAESRLHNEWFSPDAPVLEMIERLRSHMAPKALEQYDALQRVLIDDPEDLGPPRLKRRKAPSPVLTDIL